MISIHGRTAPIVAAEAHKSPYLPNHTLDIDDGVQAMERLKSGLLLVIIGLAATSAFAQQAASIEQGAGFVTVIGDVQDYRNYPIPKDSPLTVRQAVIDAGLLSQIVNVTVIRATQETVQFSQMISVNSADSVVPVESGDVLVVQSMSSMTAQSGQNAALRTDSGVMVVALENGTTIGDVLRDTQTMPPAEGRLRVLCRFQGQPPISRAELYSPAVHGDVISVSHDNRRSIKGFADMSPAVTEWKSQPTPATPIAFALIPETSRGDSTRTGDSSDFKDVQWPGMNAGSKSSESEIAENSELHNGNSESVSALPISQGQDVSDIADPESVDNKISFASESATTAPIAPPEMTMEAVTEATSSGFNPWNLLFVGGLLLVGTLILAGTLKPDPDDNSQFVDAAVRNSALNLNRSHTILPSQQTPVGSTPVKSAIRPLMYAAASPVAAEGKVESVSQPSAAVESVKSLVDRHEWFGGDWNRSVVLNDTAPPTQSLSEDRRADALNLAAVETTVESPIALPVVAAVPVTDKPVADDVIAAASAVEINSQVSLADLEDLLQNRLPIVLCEAQLPLRISLFGKPAGPRRVRIDAAHTSVPAPHMSLSADNRRAPPVATAPTAASGPTETSGGLDRALHFLQERTES